ncbi:hypothetical protein PtB15_11B584 [Puccinia triticina]|nr:hypothetical protein PtB15_11B584 [Puccinia triticina]
MNPLFSVLSVVTALITVLEYTEAAVVGLYPQRNDGSIPTPLSFLFGRGIGLEDEETDGSSLMQQLRYLSEPREVDNEPHSFMMVTTSTFSTDNMSGSDPFGEQADSPGVVSIDMTIIQLDDSPAMESRKVARRFGSRGALSIDGRYPSYAAAAAASMDSSDESASSRSAPLIQNTRAGKLAQDRGSDTHQDSWKMMNAKNTQVPLSIPTGASRTQKAGKPQHSYSKASFPAKKDIPHPFTAPAKEQIVMKSSPTFDNTSHHSQL